MEPTEHNRRAWETAHRRRPADGVPEAVRERLPELAGKHVLQLHSRGGEVAADLAALGALVTGIEPAADAVRLAHERAPTAVFLHGDPETLPVELRRGRFDLAVAGEGTLRSTRDLSALLGGVASALAPGGGLVLYDRHPVAACLDPSLRWREDYFRDGAWRLGQIVSAAVRAGLAVHRLDELAAPERARRRAPRVPELFVLLALKPGTPPAR